MEVTDRVKHVEACGRICYKSEDKITDESAGKFVRGLIKAEHLAMVEHATYALHVPAEKVYPGMISHGSFLIEDECDDGESFIISGNVRAWRNFFLSTAKEFYAYSDYRIAIYWAEPSAFDVFFGDIFPNFVQDDFDEPQRDMRDLYAVTEDDIMHNMGLSEGVQLRHLYRTFLITCDRGVTHELVRHRPASFAQESTRYCNYSGEMQFIVPSFWVADGKEEHSSVAKQKADCFAVWYNAVTRDVDRYKQLIDLGAKPQEARSILPNSLKADIIVTANVEEWDHIFELRTTSSAHPQIREVMTKVKDQLGNSL